ncbi:MAG: cyclic-di-AMP receptor [Anaerolineales bacterium]|jgi:uncharacterized protein YaaQ
MKLIIAITRDEDSEDIIKNLIREGFRVTRIASTGGFLRRGMTTLMIGVEDEEVDLAITNLKDKCRPVPENNERCTTIFVLNVTEFTQV